MRNVALEKIQARHYDSMSKTKWARQIYVSKDLGKQGCINMRASSAKVIRKKLELTVRFNPQGREARKLKRLFIIEMSWEK